MLTSLSLRLRIFLMFLGMAFASVGIVGGALVWGYQRIDGADAETAFIFGGTVASFGVLALTVGFWLLFDENVAKPIEKIAIAMRTRAHAKVDAELDLHQARYLGDLAPAVHAVSGELSKITAESDGVLSEEKAQLMAEKAHLALLLTEIPVAIVLISPNHRIILYDGQAADILGQVQVPRLSASIFDYLNEDELKAAHAQLSETRTEVLTKCHCARGNLCFDLRIKKLKQVQGYMVLVDNTHARIASDAERPLVYDFALQEHDSERALLKRPLESLSFTVFDTETTGLMPNKDEIVQIGAVRVVNGKIVPGEVIDQLVDPGRPIPPASTKVHGITDEMVKGAPDAVTSVQQFHTFAKDSVIVAHNAPFDMAFLHRYGRESGLEWDHPIMDTVLLSAVVYGTTEIHTLDALCDRLGVTIPVELRHTALGDAQATAEVLCHLLPILISKGYKTFGDVLTQTRKHGRLIKDMN
ncbi:DNA polymerase III epsilon subunit family exonuclease [Roseibium sp. TrichSKD4]|uniref:3'-5' exonuclease n=1 Tax=Roseibium sp. TrichSKD4 TaxID=744980 RepID=UPI0001E56E51|nr:3'-5' exonuclease [Roseibium sp. TrichSKD4]EFO30323.1 DNA polymerase III epsilon subunit family exonuclease [Roseibium sp. TrichSKD4]